MAQHDYNIANQTGSSFRADLNNALSAIVSNNSGASEPATTFAFQWWADTTASQLKLRNAANDAWIVIQELDGTLLMEDGTAGSPGLAFASDLDTGFFRPAANRLAIATNATERVEFGTTEVVFNDGGADCNFRVEGDTDANLFFVDAGNDRVGLGTNSPQGTLNVQGSTAAPSLTYDTADIVNLDAGTIQLAIGINSSAPFGAYLQGRATNDAARVISLNPVGGNVGIGTAAPGSKLHVYEDSAAAASIYLENTEGRYELKADANIARHFSLQHVFNNADGTAEKARLDTSGRLLVGTSTSDTWYSAQFQIAGTSYSGSAASVIRNAANSGPPSIALAKSRGSAVETFDLVSSNDGLGTVLFYGADGSTMVAAAEIKAEVDGTPGSSDMPGRLVFSTTADGASSPTERMRINSNGNIFISSSAVSNSANIVNTNGGIKVVSWVNASDAQLECFTASTGIRFCQVFTNPNGIVGSISTSGSATAYNTSSDYRLKENVVPLSGAADRLSQLQVHRFNFIADPDTTVDGFLAHEAQAVVPEAVTGTQDEVDDDGNPVYQGIDQSKLVPLLTAALQEALAEIESLKARVTALEP